MKNRRHNLCHFRIFSCHDINYCNLEKPIETERICRRMTSLVTKKSMSRNCLKKFYCDKVMNVATSKDKISGPDRETKLRQVMLT